MPTRRRFPADVPRTERSHPTACIPRWLAAMLAAAMLVGCGGSSSQNFAQCGNGVLDTGERCDDGNTSDLDACTSACQVARCGDGVVYAGVEACDGNNIPSLCQNFKLSGDKPGCASDCTLDLSLCGPAFTPTATNTATATATGTPTALPSGVPSSTPTATPTPTPMLCGDGLLAADETCDSCPDDCVAQPCEAGGATYKFAVTLQPPPAQNPLAATVTLSYRTDVVSIPGTAQESSVKTRVRPPLPLPSSFGVNDRDYQVVVQISQSTLLSNLFAVTFDGCQDAPPPTIDDLSCVVVGCSAANGPIEGCTCDVSGPTQ
jgi:cysteine-rich repeat protein